MPAVNEFIANGRTIDEINQTIGSDRLFYQTLDDLVDVTLQPSSDVMAFDASCFNGEYITGTLMTSTSRNSTTPETMRRRVSRTRTMRSLTFTTTKRFDVNEERVLFYDPADNPPWCPRSVVSLLRPDAKVHHYGSGRFVRMHRMGGRFRHR